MRQIRNFENGFINVGGLTMQKSIYNQISTDIKHKTLVDTIVYLRSIVYKGEYKGEFKIGYQVGYLFKKDSENVVVDKQKNQIIAAFIDKSGEVSKQPELIEPEEAQDQEATSKEDKSELKLNIDIKNLKPTEHYLKRVKERFFVTDKNYATKFFQDIITNGTYVGTHYSEEHELAHMFVRDNIAVLVSLDLDTVITTYRRDKEFFGHVKSDIRKYLNKKINHLRKQEQIVSTRKTNHCLDINIEIAMLERSLHRAKSESKKLAYQARIDALKQHKEILDKDHKQVIDSLRGYTHSMISFA
jgi:hypothetical protein